MLTNEITQTFASAPPSVAAPRIFANRQQVDDRFPSVGFTIDTAGQPFFEVVLTTDPSLFDPVNASRRSTSNFYSSREHSGLIQSVTSDSAVYTAPSAVLKSFAGARAIYYTAITYHGQDLSAPAFAMPIAELKTSAPAVTLAPGFQGRTLAAILSTPLDRLQRVREDGAMSFGYSSSLSSIDAKEDRAEGEDGYGLSTAQEWDGAFSECCRDCGSAAHGAAMEDSDWSSASESNTTDTDETYSDGFDGPIESASENDNTSVAYGEDDDRYSVGEGFGGSPEEQFSSSHPPGMLEDQDYHYDSSEPSASNGTSRATGYEDESESLGSYDELDHDSPGYQALDSPPPAPTASRSPSPASPPPSAPTATRPALDVAAKIALIEHIAPFESGKARYAAINADGEFEGRFKNHPAAGRYHIGLSYGVVQFTQDSGSLGRLLSMMRDRDATKFRDVFGADCDDLIRVTTASGKASKDSPGGRSARVQPVGGTDIWKEPWLARFREAARGDLFGKGNRQLFNGAQNELAASMYLDPMLRFAAWLGLITDRALAMIFDRSVQMGSGGAKKWIIGAVGPISTPAIRQQALAGLGHADLNAFQAATPGLSQDGAFGPDSHAAMVAALRAIGGRSPIPIPTRDQMLDAMERHAASTAWKHRTSQLRHATDFSDAEFQI